ncbi:MAG: hypothetical protein GY807_06860 [Gammaproteobacteria bacterium]|nr:hypothetical protein [Gammaproteobacteria bacterium]
MEHITELYRNPPEHLFLFDQLTGLQALSRVAPDSPPMSKTPARQDFVYVRHGTLSVCPVMDYRTGRIFMRTIDSTKSACITEVIAEHIDQFPPDKTLHYLCDNLAGHSTQLLCDRVAELAGVDFPKDLLTQVQRRDWLQSTNKRIVFHFLPTHGSWLNLIEIWFGVLRSQAIRGASFSSIEELEQTVHDFTETWNHHFAHPFNWSYTGKGLHALLIKRNIAWLKNEASQFSPKFLAIQLVLIQKLFQNYRDKIKPKLWQELLETLITKQVFVETILAEGPDLELFGELKALLEQGLLFFYFLCANTTGFRSQLRYYWLVISKCHHRPVYF